MKKILLTATVQSHIAQFHNPLIEMLKDNKTVVHVAAKDNLEEKNGLKLNNIDKIFDIPFSRSPFSRNNIAAYKRLKKIIEDEKYDIIHCNTPMGGLITRLASLRSRKKGTKIIYTAHGFHFYEGASTINWLVYYPIEKVMSFFTDVLITIAKEDYFTAIKKNFGSKIEHIHGVGFNDIKHRKLGSEEIKKTIQEESVEGKIVIISIGELNDNKNQITTIRAINILKKTYPNIMLFIAGNGPNREKILNEIDKYSLHDNVRLLGYTTELNKYLNISTICISMSYREGLGVNILEAMNTNNCIVASLNRGHKELVNSDYNGILVNADDYTELSIAIDKVLSDSNLREKFVKNSLKTIEKYNYNSVKKELESIYSDFINIEGENE